MRIPPFFGYEHLKAAFRVSKAAPYFYALVPHAASTELLRALWELEHRFGVFPLPPADTPHAAKLDGDAAPWITIDGLNIERFIERSKSAFRFTFTRNPYTRLFAAFRTHIEGNTRIGRRFRRAAGLGLTGKVGFETFLTRLEALPDYARPIAFAPQADWLLLDCVPYHFIGAVERFAEDYTTVLSRLAGSSEAPAPSGRAPAGPGDACTPAAQGVMKRLYAADFERLGYDTDPANAHAPPHIGGERKLHSPPLAPLYQLMVESRLSRYQGDSGSAIQRLEHAVQAGEAHNAGTPLPSLRLDLARLYLKKNDWGAVITILKPLPSPLMLSDPGCVEVLAEAELHRNDPDAALATLSLLLDHGELTAPFLKRIGAMSAASRDTGTALRAGRAIVADTTPGDARNGLIDALLDGLVHLGSPRLALSVLDDLSGIADLGYDRAGRVERCRSTATLPVATAYPAGPSEPAVEAPPKRVIADPELLALAEETWNRMEDLRQGLVRKLLETYPFLFDPAHYASQTPAMAQSGLSPIEHYIQQGSRMPNLEPNPFFNHSIYLHMSARESNPTLGALAHYVLEGAPKGIDPGPFFQNDLYVQNHPALAGSSVNPLNDHLSRPLTERGAYGVVPTYVLESLKDLSFFDVNIFPASWRLDVGKVQGANILTAQRLGAIHSQIMRDLPESFTHLVLVPWVAHPGGAERVSSYILRMMVEQLGPGKVVVIGTDLPARSGFSMPAGLCILSLSDYDPKLSYPERTELLDRLILERQPRVTFVQNSTAGWTLFAARGRYLRQETALYATLFGYGCNRHNGVYGFHPQLQSCLEHMTAIVTDNTRFPDILPTIMPMLSGHADRLHVIHTPSDPELGLHPPSPETKPRQGLWMGRFSPEKRLDIMRQIANRTPDRHYLIYGSQIPHQMPADVTALSELPNVDIHGYYRELSDVPFPQCDMLVFTSNFEGLPLVLLEATAMGLPIIAPDVGGVSDFVTAETGWLVSGTEAVEEYVAAIREIESRPDLVHLKVTAAQDLLRSRHSWASFTNAYMALPGFFSAPKAPLNR